MLPAKQPLPGLGDGEEYELGSPHGRVITDEKVLLWRRSQLVGGGFPFDWAHSLAIDGEVDLHEAIALAKHAGAQLAWRILRRHDEPQHSTDLVPVEDPSPEQRRSYMDRLRRYT